MPKYTSVYIYKNIFNKMVNQRMMGFNFKHINLLLILVFPLVPYIKTIGFSVVGTIAFKENLGKIR